MLLSLKGLKGYQVRASDGATGVVLDFLFDAKDWTVRFLVLESSGVIPGGPVLIPLDCVGGIDAAGRQFHLPSTMEKGKRSPAIDPNLPVSRQWESEPGSCCGRPGPAAPDGPAGADAKPALETQLHGADGVCGYRVLASDRAIGHLEDFMVEQGTWVLRYLVVETGNWPFSKRVLISPRWPSQIRWPEREIQLAMSWNTVKASPEWTSAEIIDREYESDLHEYYGQPAYWPVGDPTAGARNSGRL
jgi:hypothetical protein